jgi:hypothetical protein
MFDKSKKAGATVYLVEELSDARMRCDQLIRQVGDATRLVEGSPHREAVFEAAGHLLYTIPHTLFRLQKALQAAALATNRLDSEEIKSDLRPEKVRQLEDVLEDVRIRQIKRHSENTMIDPKDRIWNADTPIPSKVAFDEYPKMNRLAQNIAVALDTIKKDGEALLKEIGRVDMSGIDTEMDEGGLRRLVQVASRARNTLFGWGGMTFVDKYASDEEKAGRFEEGKPADPTKNMSPEDKKKWEYYKDENRDEFKKKAYDYGRVLAGLPKAEVKKVTPLERNHPESRGVSGLATIEGYKGKIEVIRGPNGGITTRNKGRKIPTPQQTNAAIKAFKQALEKSQWSYVLEDHPSPWK